MMDLSLVTTVLKNISKSQLVAKGIITLVRFGELIADKAVEIIKNADLSDLINWIKRGISKIKKKIRGYIFGFKQFFRRIKNKFTQIVRHFSLDNDQWYMTEIQRTTNVENVSAEMLNGVDDIECDRTKWLENKLR